jgi:AraC-like DNA-binding protein
MNLEYRELPPPPALAPFVRCFWTLTGNLPQVDERIVPDGCFELVFHRGEPFRQNGELQKQALLIGEVRRPTVLTPSRNCDVVGVRFRPGGAAAFFRFAMSEVRDAILPADEVLCFDGHGLVELLVKRRTPPRQWRSVAAAVEIIEARRGNVRIGALAKHIGISERTLQRSFEDAVGVLPKTFARLTRFQAHLAAPDGDAGYVDASHLTRDYHEFAGVTPAAYEREQHALRDNFAGNVQDAEDALL